MKQINLESYTDFVATVTSESSNSTTALVNRLTELDSAENVNPALLITSGIGLASEGGEFNEIVKKILFQGKPFNEDNRFHMKRELGDIMWYWINACRALNYNPNDIIAENVNKLKARYPGGEFNAFYSENRQENDL